MLKRFILLFLIPFPSASADEIDVSALSKQLQSVYRAGVEYRGKLIKENAQSSKRSSLLGSKGLRQVKNAPWAVGALPIGTLKVGQVGVFKSTFASGASNPGYQVSDIIDDYCMLISHPDSGNPDRIICVSGYDTSSFTTGKYFTPGYRVFEVSGKRTYRTTQGGTRTVLVMEYVSIGPLLELFRKHDTENPVFAVRYWMDGAVRPPVRVTEIALRPTDTKAPKTTIHSPKREMRTWTDATGAFTVNARFGGIIAGKVQLIKDDGSRVPVSRAQLSKEDNHYLDGILGDK